MAKSPKPAEQSSAAAPAVSSQATEGAAPAAGATEADEAIRRVADLGAAVLADPAAALVPSGAEVKAAVTGYTLVQADAEAAREQAMRYVPPKPTDADPASEVAAAVEGWRAEAEAVAAREQAGRYPPHEPPVVDTRRALAEHYGIPVADILGWNFGTWTVVTIDGRKLTPKLPGDPA